MHDSNQTAIRTVTMLVFMSGLAAPSSGCRLIYQVVLYC